MKLIVGLGNPGKKYTQTRHNAGKLFVEYLAAEHGKSFKKKRSLEASVVSFDWNDEPVVLSFPETFMNLSGHPVSLLVRHFEVDPVRDLLVVVDDLALPFGRLRIRSSGSDGGHNGLKSVHAALDTQRYARLRVGIALSEVAGKGLRSGADREIKDYVLAPFDEQETALLKTLWERAQKACRLWIFDSMAAAMNEVNAAS